MSEFEFSLVSDVNNEIVIELRSLSSFHAQCQYPTVCVQKCVYVMCITRSPSAYANHACAFFFMSIKK